MTVFAAPVRVDASRAHLAARMEVLESRVTLATERRRGHRDDAAPPVLPPSDLLDRVEAAIDDAEESGEPTRLRTLQRRFGLSPLDTALLVTALALDVDARFERLYAYLQDDLTRRRPTIGLALELAGTDAMDPLGRAALHPAGRLVAFGLLDVADADRPYLSRTLRVPDRVTAYLLGDDTPDPAVEPYFVATVAWPGPGQDHLVNALRAGTRLFYAHEQPGASAGSQFAAALIEVGLRVIEIDLSAAAGGAAGLVPAVLREVGLSGAGLVINRADELARHDPPVLRRFAEASAVVCFAGRSLWDPHWARVLPFIVEAPAPPIAARAELWQAILAGEAGAIDALSAVRMTPVQMISAVDWARRRAGSEQRPVAAGDLAAGVRHVTSAAMAQVSTRVTPSARWSDLILAAPTERAVRKVAERAHHQDLVRRVWGLGATTRRRGTTALFNGPPGTGKTLAAKVLACELGVDLYVVDLDTVVDMDEVFHAADEITAMLLFEGADALLGTLLRRLDRFDGLAVLTASLDSDLDEVFARRIDVAVAFTLPDAPQRQAIWRRSLPAELPLDADVDVAFLGDAFTLSGGQIRTVCVEAAFLAADDGGPVRMEHLIRATAAEQRKLGLVPSATEFQQHLPLALRELAER